MALWTILSDPNFFYYVILPILIFFARIADVSLDTVRIILMSKGYKLLPPVLGFFEVIIWLLAVSRILSGPMNWVGYLAYGAGFGTGTYVGMVIDEKLSLGKVSLNIVIRRNAKKVIQEIRKTGHLMTVTDAHGEGCEVKFLYMVLNRQDVNQIISIVKKYNPTAFYSIQEVRLANDDEQVLTKASKKYSKYLAYHRKGK